MMNIEYEKMDGRARKLYEAMWNGFKFESIGTSIKKTYSTRYKKDSDNSYCFDGGSDKEQLLIKIFGIKNKAEFKKKYKMATSGSGEEDRKITTLHSSSLCALLHFYNITKNTPLTLELVTDKHPKRTVKFTESYFEYKSPVINNPSNMDVVLLGKDNGQDVVLLLESKFSEYFLGASSVLHDVSNQYLDKKYASAPLYTDEVLKKMGLRKKPDGEGYFKLESFDGQFYIGGIKQMISHYTGVMNVLNGESYDEKGRKSEVQEKVKNAINKENAVVILGEIVFDSIIGDLELRPKVKCGSAYSEKYEKLAMQIKDLTKENMRFEIITKELGYSLFKDNKHKIEPKIKEFYRY
ncbi:MAG: hypothetical protein E7300_08685 [Lachnospiraceae bacterium]|nr:hypothetical protein [Lachnospiraceae bacterium]